MENQFSFKNFENVRLKATYNMEIGNRTIDVGETIVMFDKVQIAGLNEITNRVSANGGFDNRARVFWETANEQRITFSQGVFNKVEFELLSNSRLIEKSNNQFILLTAREVAESNEDKQFTLKNEPVKNLFVYKAADGSKLEYTVNNKVVTINDKFVDVIVDYQYAYTKDTSIYLLGQKYLNGFLELEGITRVKDDVTGQVVTGILRIPHLKLMSDLSIRLGAQANPVVANFSAIGVPVGARGNTYISEFYLLSDDIQSDL